MISVAQNDLEAMLVFASLRNQHVHNKKLGGKLNPAVSVVLSREQSTGKTNTI